MLSMHCKNVYTMHKDALDASQILQKTIKEQNRAPVSHRYDTINLLESSLSLFCCRVTCISQVGLSGLHYQLGRSGSLLNHSRLCHDTSLLSFGLNLRGHKMHTVSGDFFFVFSTAGVVMITVNALLSCTQAECP